MHGHANMEIITDILSGALEHKDSLGSGSVIRPGDVQVMSAGKGILHSEFNPSPDEDVHLLQIWIMPSERDTKPAYQEKRYDPADFDNRFRVIVSGDGRGDSLRILQDAAVLAARLGQGKTVSFAMQQGRKYWLQVARGAVDAFGQTLEAGDALALENETAALDIISKADAELLLFDLPAE